MTFAEWWKVAGNKDWDLVIGAFRDCWNTAAEEEREACAKVAEEIEDSMAEAIAERIRRRGR